MVFYKLDKYDKYFVAFILVILVIFNIGQCFAVEVESVDSTLVTGLQIIPNNNFFASNSGHSVRYIVLEKGYIYHFTNNQSNLQYVCFSYDIPAVNVPFYDFRSVPSGESFSFVSNDYDYFYFSGQDTLMQVTREKIPNMDGAVGDLVSNVGINQLWSTFESGIDFVGVVVLVAFGLFLIVLLIKKLSKGKSDF